MSQQGNLSQIEIELVGNFFKTTLSSVMFPQYSLEEVNDITIHHPDI